MDVLILLMLLVHSTSLSLSLSQSLSLFSSRRDIRNQTDSFSLLTSVAMECALNFEPDIKRIYIGRTCTCTCTCYQQQLYIFSSSIPPAIYGILIDISYIEVYMKGQPQGRYLGKGQPP